MHLYKSCTRIYGSNGPDRRDRSNRSYRSNGSCRRDRSNRDNGSNGIDRGNRRNRSYRSYGRNGCGRRAGFKLICIVLQLPVSA